MASGSFLLEWPLEMRACHDFETHRNWRRDLKVRLEKISNKISAGSVLGGGFSSSVSSSIDDAHQKGLLEDGNL